MFQSKIFKSNGTSWSPYHGRNFLLIPEDEKTFLNNIPGWSDKGESCAVVREKDKSSILDVYSADPTETEAQTIPSKEELLKSFVQFEAISNLKGKRTISVDINNSALSKCKSLLNISNIRAPVLCVTRSSSLPNLFKTSEFLFSKTKCQNLMENINLNQTYTVQYQRAMDNCIKEVILEVDECEYLKKDVVNSFSKNGEAKYDISKKSIIDSFSQVNSKEQNSDLSKAAFRIYDHKPNDEDQNIISDVNVQKQNKSLTCNGENILNADKIVNNSQKISQSSTPMVKENTIEPQCNENLSDSKFYLTQDDIPISQEIPCAQPVLRDSNPFSLIGTQRVKEIHVVESTEIQEKSQIETVNKKHAKSVEIELLKPVMDVHIKSSEVKEHSQIMNVDSEACAKLIEALPLESEKTPATKVSRKRKHTKDKSRKGSSSSKSARTPEIYYSETELKSMLNCLKLCFELNE